MATILLIRVKELQIMLHEILYNESIKAVKGFNLKEDQPIRFKKYLKPINKYIATGEASLEDLKTNPDLALQVHHAGYEDQKKVYEVNSPLTEALLQTDIKIDLSKLQFDEGTYMVYPNFSGILSPVKGFYFTIVKHEGVIVVSTCKIIWDKEEHTLTPMFMFRDNIDAKISSDDLPHYIYEPDPLGMLKTSMDSDISEGFKVWDRIILMYIFNLLLYIQTKQDEEIVLPPKHIDLSVISNPKKLKRATKQNNEMTECTISYLGKRYTGIKNEHTETIKHIEGSFIVRGHWRNQKVGVGRKEIRLLWIEPFMKGSGDLKTKIVRVK